MLIREVVIMKEKKGAISDPAFSPMILCLKLLLDFPSCSRKTNQTNTEQEHDGGFRGRHRVGRKDAQRHFTPVGVCTSGIESRCVDECATYHPGIVNFE